MFQRMTPVVKNILIINVIIFLASQLYKELPYYLALHYPESPYFYPWQYITSMFTQYAFFHLFGNMLAVIVFGSMLESKLGSKKFLIFYMICGVGAGMLYTLGQFLGVPGMSKGIWLVGASGAVFGLLVSFAMYFPDVRLMLLFPPIPIKAKWLAIGYLAFEAISLLSGSGGNVAHEAHLTGALIGYLLTKFWLKRNDFNRYY